MRTVLLRLDGPLQAWGATSAFERRATERWPTKSGVLGMLAAALGWDRSTDLTRLAALDFAVRVDQAGRVIVDFHTAGASGWRNAVGKVTHGPIKLSTRRYLADAVFVAAVGGDDDTLIEQVDAALAAPVYHLFLGRRSCPPASPLDLGVVDTDPVTALSVVPYQGRSRRVPARLLLAHTDPAGITVADQPLSYAPLDRRYGQRGVSTRWVTVPGPDYPTPVAVNDDDDPDRLDDNPVAEHAHSDDDPYQLAGHPRDSAPQRAGGPALPPGRFGALHHRPPPG